jgi:hypothetical protein
MRWLDSIIVNDPKMEQTLSQHREEQAHCIFCGGLFSAPAVYYEPDLLVQGKTLVMVYSLCEACLGSDDLMERCAAEYARDKAYVEAQTQRRQRAWLN